jgi:hypothetical protein
LLNARRVAETISHKITGMNPGQGFAANLSTAALVTTASLQNGGWRSFSAPEKSISALRKLNAVGYARSCR